MPAAALDVLVLSKQIILDSTSIRPSVGELCITIVFENDATGCCSNINELCTVDNVSAGLFAVNILIINTAN